jgi:hypothetical protein
VLATPSLSRIGNNLSLWYWWQLDEQAVEGATLEFMDGVYRDVLRRISAFTRSNSTLSFTTPLISPDKVQVEELDLTGSINLNPLPKPETLNSNEPRQGAS